MSAITDEQLQAWAKLAKRDDWDCHFVGSDLRQLIGEVQRSRHASAIKAGTAETPESGSVHESAGPQDDAHA